MNRLQISHFLFVGVLFLLAAESVDAASVDGSYGPAIRYMPAQRLLAIENAVSPPPSLQIELPRVSAEELSAMQARRAQSKAYMIGFGRPVPAPYRDDVISLVHWTEAGDGSKIALIAIRSPGAVALRAELDLGGTPSGVQFRYLALSANKPPIGPMSYQEGPLASETSRHHRWSPVVPGDALGIEIRLPPGLDPAKMVLPILRISHITESPLSPLEPRTGKALGDASLCEIDVACRDTAPWDTVKDAVAKVTFVDDGNSFLCTGTLLTDQEEGTWIPYLHTANHCVDNAEAAATLNSFWFFQQTDCSGTVNNGTHLSAGAWLLAHDEISDFSLMELAEPAPGGAFFAGWSTDTNLFQAVSGIHHPKGDVKKISDGSILGASFCRELGNCSFDDIEVVWTEGHTESGSSGSGLFDSSGKLVGTLWGGASRCTAQTTVVGSDSYGRFTYTLPRVTRFLEAVAIPRSAGSVSQGSVEQESWRDFRFDVDNSTRFLEVILHELDGNADLFVRIGGKPSANNYQCASENDGITAEFCTLRVVPGHIVYIGIMGLQAVNFSLTLNTSESGAGLADAGTPAAAARLPQARLAAAGTHGYRQENLR